MKKLRFLIAIVLIFSLLPVFGVSASEQTTNEIKATETSDFKKLEAFGLISEEDTIFYYENVKRGTFMSYVMKCYLGYGASAPIPGIENPFADVTDKTEDMNAILTAAYTGLVNGAKGSAFRPDDYITKSEAAKIFVTMLGYGEQAERKGGYPSGYLATAQLLGVFNGCEFSEEGYFPVKSFLKAYGNVLDTEILDLRSITVSPSGKIVTQEFKVVEDKTLLYNVFGIYEAKGVVQSNEYTSINGKSTLSPGEVLINGYTYKVNNADAVPLLGYNTHYYYKKAKGATRGELVHIEPYRNNVASTFTDNIVKDAVTESNFRYYPDETSERYFDLKISSAATLISNGDLKDATKENMCPHNGTVTLIDNNDDRVYDIIFVMDYRTIMVSSIMHSTFQVMDGFGKASIELDPEAEDYTVIFDIEQPVGDEDEPYNADLGLFGGYRAPVKNEFSEIKVGDIILYAESLSNARNIKQVKVSKNKIEGTVDSMVKDYFTIDGKKYRLSPDAKYPVALGETGTFYVDAFGKIVSKLLAKDVVYGYLNDINKDTSGFGTIYQLQIFSDSGRWVILELADNVKTNLTNAAGAFVSMKAANVYNTLNAMPNFKQLINYTVNKDGRVNNITIAQRVEAYSSAEKDAIEQGTFRKVYLDDWGNNNEDCKATESGIMSEFGKGIGFADILFNEMTRIFVICEENPELTQIDSMSRINIGGPFIPYNMNEDRELGAVVVFKTEKSFRVGTGGPFVIVDSPIKAVNRAGELVSGISGISEGIPVTLIASGNKVSAAIDLLQKGDIIQVALNKDGEIYDYPPVVSTSDPTIDLDTDAKYGAVKRRLNIKNPDLKLLNTTTEDGGFGEVCTVDRVNVKQKRILVTGKNNKKRFVKVSDTTKYYVYDTEKYELSNATVADVSTGMRIFVRRAANLASDIIVIK